MTLVHHNSREGEPYLHYLSDTENLRSFVYIQNVQNKQNVGAHTHGSGNNNNNNNTNMSCLPRVASSAFILFCLRALRSYYYPGRRIQAYPHTMYAHSPLPGEPFQPGDIFDQKKCESNVSFPQLDLGQNREYCRFLNEGTSVYDTI